MENCTFIDDLPMKLKINILHSYVSLPVSRFSLNSLKSAILVMTSPMFSTICLDFRIESVVALRLDGATSSPRTSNGMGVGL